MRASFEAAGIELLWAAGEPFGIGRTATGPLAAIGNRREQTD
jgi:hypothetical protein